MNQENLLNKIRQKDAKAFTHGGKFHADDIFSSALLLYLNPEIQITRGNQVPEEYDGIVFDIGRGAYDHHQKEPCQGKRDSICGIRTFVGRVRNGDSWRRTGRKI